LYAILGGLEAARTWSILCLEMTKPAYSWHPIEDYEVDPAGLARSELRELAAVWDEQRDALEQIDGLRAFNEKLNREWAIETGLLERVYTLDRGVTQILIERGIDAALIPRHQNGQDPERVAAILRDHEAVVEGLFLFVKGARSLSTSYVKELHAQLTRNQRTMTAIDSMGRTMEVTLVHGEYKNRPNNPTRRNGSLHEYCPPEHVASEMDRLVALHLEHDGASVPPEVEAAWLHHRFTQIHPFQDGNGRVARALASLVFIRAGWFPLVIRDTASERGSYIAALETADGGGLEPLVRIFSTAQKKALVQALGISGQVIRSTRPEQVIKAAGAKLEERKRRRIAEWEKAKETARRLQDVTEQRLEEIVTSLERETSGYLPGAKFRAETVRHGEGRDYYFRGQIIDTARHLDYYANTQEHRAWSRLVLRGDVQAEIVVSVHGTGHEFRGVLAVSACFFRREETEEGERQIVGLTPLSDEIFQINYRENEVAAVDRFRDWLEEALVRGLELWRKTL
jgi:Fic family protein